MSAPPPLDSILIVGGSAGWITASYLARMLRRQRIEVTLVESPDIGTIGVGDHSSAHVDPDRASEILIAHAGSHRKRLADPRLLRMRIGRRTRFWNRNCIAIGLAGGFVEPIESTGLNTTLRGVELLFEYLPGIDTNPVLRDAYNDRMGRIFDEVRDFIMLHYRFARRAEPFWRDARAVPLTPTLERLLALYDEFGQIEPVEANVFADTSYYLILDGSGRYPRRPHPRTSLAPPREIDEALAGLRRHNAAIADTLPSHLDLLDAIHLVRP